MSLTDEDGIDGPFERAMTKAMREDKKPSIKQMAVRSNPAHRMILAALIDGTPYQVRSTSDARGISTAKGTLIRWGCIDSVRDSYTAPPRAVVTDRGRELLAYLRSKDGAK